MMTKRKAFWLLIIIVFATVYLYNISGSLMHDDEGSDLYEIWQLQKGNRPGEDYLAEQQPLYLIAGSTLIDLFGRSILPLRLLSAFQVLIGAFILAVVVRSIWGERAAVLSLGVTLMSGLVYEQARLFRPDPMMLAWEVIGLAAALMAVKEEKRLYWGVAGASYGIAFLWKPFALFPMIGLVCYFIHWLWRSRSNENKIEPIIAGIYFSLPFLLIGGGVAFLLYNQLGFYYGEIYSQHAQLGAELGFLDLGRRFLLFYFLFFWINGIFILVFPLWFVNRKTTNLHQNVTQLLLWQLVSPLIFVTISRPLYLRYFFYLVPILAVLLGWQIDISLRNLVRERKSFRYFQPVIVLLLLLFTVVITRPNVPQTLLQKESDTLRLADYIAANTRPGDKVLADYAGLNFFSNRDSIYEASIVAGGRIRGQLVTGDLLIRRIEAENVQMVLIHISDGYPPPQQLIELVDYKEFRDYLEEHFSLLTVFDRAGQKIEVWQSEE